MVLLFPTIVHPHHVGVAGAVAVRPVLVLHEARVVRVAATSGEHAILMCTRTLRMGEHCTIPVVFVSRRPPLPIDPQIVVGTRCITSRPMLVLLETCLACHLAPFCLHTILMAMGSQLFLCQHRAIPMFLAGRRPTLAINPQIIVGTRLVAGRPILILHETCVARCVATHCVFAILMAMRTARLHLIAIPMLCLARCPTNTIDPEGMLVARLVACRPMLIFLVALTLGVCAAC